MVEVLANPSQSNPSGQFFGWREWAALPQLRIKRLRVKIDTGARTSALHAFEVLPFERNGQPWVRFGLHLSRKHGELAHWCEAPMLDRRVVTDSGGHAEERYVIASTIVFGNAHWPLAITLTNRDTMRYRMLVGRSGLPLDAQVLPHHAWLQGQPSYDKQAFRTGGSTGVNTDRNAVGNTEPGATTASHKTDSTRASNTLATAERAATRNADKNA